jgi:hypothetical protein
MLRVVSLFISLSLIIPALLYAQSVEEIKKQSHYYIWGEGAGSTLKTADNEALQILISQISVQVESRFQHFIREEESTSKKADYEFEEKVKSVVNTYSNATLHNTERIVISNEPDARVFRYIERKNVNRVFRNRKDKILDFVDNARKAVKERRIGDGLRYYYWAFTLLKSHPDCNDIRYTSAKGKEHPLISWIPMQMNEIFLHIDFHVNNKEKQEEMKRVILKITYQGDPVDNLDYSYWDGRDWSNLINVKDGRGILEYYGVAAEEKKKGRVKTEYIYENQANIDNELKTVMEKIDPIPFRKSYYAISFTDVVDSAKNYVGSKAARNKHDENSLTKIKNPSDYQLVLDQVQKAIQQRNYQLVKNLFTPSGFEMFEKLIAYGKARIIYEPEQTYYKFRKGVMARALPMAFDFNNNDEQFVEDVVFHFNGSRKIESLSFGLSKDATRSILNKEVWDEIDRMVLVNFLEHYKTAYALKRLDYIESIFAEDALIITGYVLKVKPNADSRYQSNQIVRYNRQSKAEYIRNLRYSFQSKEYINIQFEESNVRKGGKGGDIYGVQIKQNYYSSNYGDQGYLFLMVDLNDPKEPIIHVRTWQPTKGKQDSIYGLSDF